MATPVASVLSRVRTILVEPSTRFWTDAELLDHMNAGIKDLWRAIADLKQEHFIVIDKDVTLPANSSQLANVPVDVHKIVFIEPLDLTDNGPNPSLFFRPLDYYNERFMFARARPPIQSSNDTIYYDIHGAGGPTGVAPTIRIAPQISSTVQLSFGYVPVLAPSTVGDNIPIPGEADNALVAWTVAYARAKERDDRMPDAGWIQVYATEKAAVLQSLGLRQYQEPKYVNAEFEQYWG